MMLRTVFGALWGHWRRNLLQLFTLIAGLALATALWSGVQAINSEARASYQAAADTLGEGSYAQILAPEGVNQTIEDFVALRRAGWLVTPVIEGRYNGVRLIGVDPLTSPSGLGGGDVSVDAGDFDPQAIWANPDAVDRLQDLNPMSSADIAPNTAVGDIGRVSAILEQTHLSRLIVLPNQPDGIPDLASIRPDLQIRQPQGGSDIARLTDSFHLNLTAFGFLSFAVGIFIVHGAVGLAFEQRRPMVRTLRALGVPLAALLRLMALEMVVFATTAGAVGVALGYVVASLLLPDVAATLRGLYGADVAGSLSLRPAWWATGLGIALVGAFAASAGVFFQLSRLQPLDSGKARAWSMMAQQRQSRLGVIGVMLLIAAAFMSRNADGLVIGFALLGALLLGGAFLLPWVLGVVLRVGQMFARSAMSQWFWADTRQQLPGLSLALMALLLAMSANIGVSTMVSSFRLTFIGFLDQRLASELYFDASSAEQAIAFEAFASGQSVDLLPIEQVAVQVAGVPAELYGPVDHPTYEENWRFVASVPEPWTLVHSGRGVVINEQLFYRAELALGDQIAVADVTLPIVGIYGDYGNPVGQVIVLRDHFVAAYPDVQATSYGIRIGSQDVPDFIERAGAEMGIEPSQFINQEQVKSFSLDVFERTFSVTGALNVLTLAVAGFAILMSLLTLSALRLPQLAPVWALGQTRRSLAWREVLRAVLLAALTVVFAIPLGIVLAFVLLDVINVAAFGWRLPMYLTPQNYGVLVVQALIAAVLAAAWPAWRLARIPPTELLKVFANER